MTVQEAIRHLEQNNYKSIYAFLDANGCKYNKDIKVK